MTITYDELRSIMDAIWQSLLGSSLTATAGASAEPRSSVVGRVEITGGWEGAVTVDCDAELAADVAAAMFGLEDGNAAPDEIRDALGELANMAGGNIKSLLPAPSQLGLPTVSDDVEPTSIPDDVEPLHSVTFDVDGKHIRLNVFENSALAHPEADGHPDGAPCLRDSSQSATDTVRHAQPTQAHTHNRDG